MTKNHSTTFNHHAGCSIIHNHNTLLQRKGLKAYMLPMLMRRLMKMVKNH